MSPQWYWRTQGDARGPFSTEELERLVRQNRIADTDQIRLGQTDEWMSAADIKATFAGSKEPSSSETPSESAARLLSHADHARLSRQVEGASRSTALAGLLRKGGRGLTGILGTFGDWLAAGLEQLSRVRILLGRKATLAVIVIILLAVIFKNIDLGGTQNQEVFDQLSITWDQIQSLKERGGSEAEWKEFQQQTLAWLNPMLQSIEETANRKSIVRQSRTSSGGNDALARRELLWAGRTLREMLEASSPPRAVEQRFLSHMSDAHTFLTEEPSIRPSEGEGATAQAVKMDPLLAGMLLLDAVLIGGVAFWWWRGRALG